MEDLNNNCLTSHGKSQETSNEPLFKMGNRKADAEKQCEEQKRKKDQNEKMNQENHNIFENNEIFSKKIEFQDDFQGKKNDDDDHDSVLGNKNSGNTPQKSRPDSKEKLESSSDCEGFGSEKESNKKSKPLKESPKDGKQSFSYESSDKYSKRLFELANVKEDSSPGISRSSEAQNRKRKKKEKHVSLKHRESEYKGHSKPQNKNAKRKHKDKESNIEEPSLSFESYLNYDEKVFKRKERAGAKKPPKKIKTVVKEDPGMKPVKSPLTSVNFLSPQKV